MIVDECFKTSVDSGRHWRRGEIIWKIRLHHNNIVFLLVPLLLMILRETSALPPIIKIGEWQILTLFTVTHHYSRIHYCLYILRNAASIQVAHGNQCHHLLRQSLYEYIPIYGFAIFVPLSMFVPYSQLSVRQNGKSFSASNQSLQNWTRE